MTEREWHAAHDPLVLLDAIFPNRGHDSTAEQSRAARWYLIGCARRLWARLPWSGRRLVEVSEQLLNGTITCKALRRGARDLAEKLYHLPGDPEDLSEIDRGLRDLEHAFEPRTDPDPEYAEDEWRSIASIVFMPYYDMAPILKPILREHHAIDVLRDVFTCPDAFRPWFAHEWLDRDVTGIANGIRESGNYSRMPILADALESAGCDHEQALQHCRSGGPHFPGCWVLEATLHPPDLRAFKKR